MREKEDIPFWNRAKKHIRAHKISQKNFAEYIGVNYNTLKFWMCYGYYPDVKTTYDIATALGVSIEFLLTGEEGKAMKIREHETLARKTAAANIKKMALRIEKNAGVIG